MTRTKSIFSVCVCALWILESHLLKCIEDLWDLLGVQQSLGHERQACLSISLHLIIAVVILHRSNLERETDRDLKIQDL